MRRANGVVLLLLAWLAASFSACKGGCAGRDEAARERQERRLALVPAEARIVASVDLSRIRATKLWQSLATLAKEDPEARKVLAELEVRTGLDPLRQVHRILVAFPDDARARGELGLIIEGEGFDEKRLVAYARDRAALRGRGIDQRSYAGRTLWTAADGGATAFFIKPSTFVFGAGGWGERMAALAADESDARSATDEGELLRLSRRIDLSRALWFAALVPQDVRQALLADPRYDSAASVTRLAGAADVGPGLTADLVAELSNARDAEALVRRIQASLRATKSNAKVLTLGLGPYVDAVSARALGATARLTVSLTPAQLEELAARLSAAARLVRERHRR